MKEGQMLQAQQQAQAKKFRTTGRFVYICNRSVTHIAIEY